MNKTKEALGRKSRMLKIQNKSLTLIAVAKKPQSFTELLKETGLSRATLTQHIKELQRDNFIYKDTIKPDKASKPEEIGKVVYRVNLDNIGTFIMQVESGFMILPYVDDDAEIQKKMSEHYKALAELVYEYFKKKVS